MAIPRLWALTVWLVCVTLPSACGVHALNDLEDASGRARVQSHLSEVELPADFVVLAHASGDVTGDGVPDVVCLGGKKEQPADLYSGETRLFVRVGQTGNQIEVAPGPLSGGYGGTVFLGDFNGDHISDILVGLPTGGSGGTVLYSVFSCAGELPQILFDQQWLSQGPQLDVQFEDGFRARVWNYELRRSFMLDLSASGRRYADTGVYTPGGRLLKTTTGVCDSYSLVQPRDLDRDGTFELVGFQEIWGLYHADTIGVARSVWRWREEGWELQSVGATPPKMVHVGSYETALPQLLELRRRVTLTLNADGSARMTQECPTADASEAEAATWTGRWRGEEDGTATAIFRAGHGPLSHQVLGLRLRGDEMSVARADPSTSSIEEIALTRIPAAPALAPRSARGHIFRGDLVLGPEARLLTLCDTDQKAWVTDRTGELWNVYESLAKEPYHPIFVEMRALIAPPVTTGIGSGYDHHLIVTQVCRAADEGHGCDEDLRGIEFRAMGNEPFWYLTVSESGIALSELEAVWEEFPYVRASVSPGRYVYYATTKGPERHSIAAVFEEEACLDSMSGERFAYTAQVTLDGQRYTGCARLGFLPATIVP